jgi:hypothetical protein
LDIDAVQRAAMAGAGGGVLGAGGNVLATAAGVAKALLGEDDEDSPWWLRQTTRSMLL